MVSTKTIILAVAAAILPAVSAHMEMATPVPYGLSSLNNSPLAADGSDFPCKQRTGVYDDQGAAKNAGNSAAVGGSVSLTFKGSAVHGGGSCQISLTSDQNPTKNSKWMVINSIEGGCPASATGNLAEGSNDPSKYTFTIPDGIVPGSYTLAWTWFNRIGNREMYMNCAPFTVTGSKRGIEARKEKERFAKRASFPDMFLANIGGGTCTTEETFDLEFPDPGAYVQKMGTASNLKAAPATCGASSGGTSGGASSPVASASSSVASAASSPATTLQAAVATSPAAAAVTSVPVATISVTSMMTVQSTVVASPAAAAAPTAAPSGTTSTTTTSSCGTEGALVCSSDGTQFGLCSNGSVAMMPVASGTKCSNGVIGFA